MPISVSIPRTGIADVVAEDIPEFWIRSVGAPVVSVRIRACGRVMAGGRRICGGRGGIGGSRVGASVVCVRWGWKEECGKVGGVPERPDC